MPRLAKATQTAFDELDRPCAAADIKGCFMPNVRIALGVRPSGCDDSVEHAAMALARSTEDHQIPTGYGAAFVRHFCKRSEQLEPVVTLPIEHRFALVELTLLAGLAGRWPDGSLSRTTAASHREYVRQVAEPRPITHLRREQWRRIVAFMLDSPKSSSFVIRNIAYALVWCGHFSPDRSAMTDKYIAHQFFDTDRAEFVRFRQEALRWLPKLLEFSLLPGGPP